MHHGEQLIFEVQIFALQLAYQLRLDTPLTSGCLKVTLGQLLSRICEKPLHSFYFILWKDIQQPTISYNLLFPFPIFSSIISPPLQPKKQHSDYYLSYKQNRMNHSGENTFTKAAKSSLYNTSNQEYGTPWVQNNTRAERVDLKKDVVPTYSEIVGSLGDFKRAERLIKSKVIRQNLQREGVEANSENARYQKKTEFHVTKGYSAYPDNGLNVGPATYQTNNMNYGNSRPADFQIQEKYFPCNSNFSKGFNGGAFKFNGLNTVKTVSQVHTFLNDM